MNKLSKEIWSQRCIDMGYDEEKARRIAEGIASREEMAEARKAYNIFMQREHNKTQRIKNGVEKTKDYKGLINLGYEPERAKAVLEGSASEAEILQAEQDLENKRASKREYKRQHKVREGAPRPSYYERLLELGFSEEEALAISEHRASDDLVEKAKVASKRAAVRKYGRNRWQTNEEFRDRHRAGRIRRDLIRQGVPEDEIQNIVDQRVRALRIKDKAKGANVRVPNSYGRYAQYEPNPTVNSPVPPVAPVESVSRPTVGPFESLQSAMQANQKNTMPVIQQGITPNYSKNAAANYSQNVKANIPEFEPSAGRMISERNRGYSPFKSMMAVPMMLGSMAMMTPHTTEAAGLGAQAVASIPLLGDMAAGYATEYAMNGLQNASESLYNHFRDKEYMDSMLERGMD